MWVDGSLDCCILRINKEITVVHQVQILFLENIGIYACSARLHEKVDTNVRAIKLKADAQSPTGDGRQSGCWEDVHGPLDVA